MAEMTKVSPPGWTGAAYVLGLQSCLGFAYYGTTANLVLLLQNYAGASESSAESLTNYFGAVVGLTPLLGGFLSDKVLGCYNTILTGGALFAVSLIGISAAVALQAARFLLLPILFGLLPVGYGLLTSNMNVFGAHQFATEKDKTSWFSWFYFSINIGSILAFLGPGMIQQNYSFAWGIAGPSAILCTGLLVFASARDKFVHPAAGTNADDGAGEANDETRKIDLEGHGQQDPSPVDTTQVWKKVVPAILMTVIFSICYCQMQTTWYVQGLWMNRKSPIGHFEIPVAYMMCADPLFVMLGIYILEGFVFPKLREMGRMPAPVTRMALGMLFSCAGMYSAYHVEQLRLQAVTMDGNLANPAPVSILLQVPQFAFVAFAEIFVYTTIQDYCFSLAPDSMKSRINSANLFSGCVANVIAGVMTSACSTWIPPTNPNLGHYDRFYLLLGVLSLLGGFGFHCLRESPKPAVPPLSKGLSYGSL